MKKLLILFIIFPILIYSQEKKIYITPATAKSITSKIRSYDSLKNALTIAKKELYNTKQNILKDSILKNCTFVKDSIYEYEYIENNIALKKLEKQNLRLKKNRTIASIIIGILTILYIFK